MPPLRKNGAAEHVISTFRGARAIGRSHFICSAHAGQDQGLRPGVGRGGAARTTDAFHIIAMTSSDELSAPVRLFDDADLDGRRTSPNADIMVLQDSSLVGATSLHAERTAHISHSEMCAVRSARRQSLPVEPGSCITFGRVGMKSGGSWCGIRGTLEVP